MKKLLVAVAVSSSLLMGGCATTAESLDPSVVTMNKKMISMERGVVLMADNVQAKPSEMNKSTQTMGAALIGAGAATAITGSHYDSGSAAGAGAAIALVGLATIIAGEVSDQPVPAMRYTIQLMDDKRTMTEVIQVVPQGEGALIQNQPIFLKSYSDGSSYIFADKTQGVMFTKAEETNFSGDAEAQAKEDRIAAEQAKQDAEDKAWAKEQMRRRIEAETKKQETISDKTADIIDANNAALSKDPTLTINVNK
ncbi:hypothetical protein HGP28_18350 [Vibrio sp. SM6]|uniref:Glycine zipper family protein n=1 Tax=Vibrio agarilyticus TaxID=2726741 RepID=A0A7X8TU39_9VIBR|nr:hypothetical protein [Vibrio agarilyticus]NLS14823.1 hypothetical protein [Vibrio agarilyticus]